MIELRWFHRSVGVDDILSEADKREFCEHYMDPDPVQHETVLQYRVVNGAWRDVPHQFFDASGSGQETK